MYSLEGHVLIKHKEWKSPITIGARSGHLYRLQFDTPKALMRNSNPRDLGEYGIGGWAIFIMEHLDCFVRW